MFTNGTKVKYSNDFKASVLSALAKNKQQQRWLAAHGVVIGQTEVDFMVIVQFSNEKYPRAVNTMNLSVVP